MSLLRKELSRDKLIELLQSIPKNSSVAVNSVRNLTIISEYDMYIGYIDFLEGSVVMNDDGKINLELFSK